MALDRDAEAEVVRYLETLLSRYHDGTNGDADRAHADFADQIDSASDDEMFELIDKQLSR
jgi:hypothetical protein